MFFVVAAPIYIPTTSVQGFLFLHVLINTYFCLFIVVSHVRLFATPWTVTHQASLSRQEYWSVLPFPSPGGLLDPGIETETPMAPALQADSLPLAPPAKP